MKKIINRRAVLALMTLGCLAFIPAQDRYQAGARQEGPSSGEVRLALGNPGPYTTVERSDWSRYDNGQYIGHVYREVRASITPRTVQEGPNPLFLYQGNFFVLEETLRDMRQSAQAVDAVIPVSFRIDGKGALRIEDDRGFPALRGFPAFPEGAVQPGARWTAPGSRAVDPLNSGQIREVPLTAEYEYRGIELYRDIPVHRIFARYASRYAAPASAAPASAGPDQGFTRLEGTHNVDILLRVSDGLPLLMRDSLDETFSWPDGSTVRFRGFTLTFGEGAIPLDREALVVSLGKSLGPSAGGIGLAAVSEGIRLTINDIRFRPDSAEFLPEEQERLDLIARALSQIPGRTFLVEGHTAALGRPEGERELSVQRARRMVEELVRRGIAADRFIYKGWGGAKPLGDNATEPGRARNRRVEITVLE
jgi:outer membrane protein OmpA-like peptidoglycan-associated protein